MRALGEEIDAFPDSVSGGSMTDNLQELVVKIVDMCANLGMLLRAFLEA